MYNHVKHILPHSCPPTGILLHGPPGCGKTTIAKAIATEAKTRFINLNIPTLTNMYYGESQKMATAVFTLAHKIKPCIIFIDEIDAFLSKRGQNDHEATSMMKAQFMIQWDGLQSNLFNSGVIVLGATNRKQAIDQAILRRFSMIIKVPMPGFDERAKILQLLLENTKLDTDVDYKNLAYLTDGYSGSDLRVLCKDASCQQFKSSCSEIIKLAKHDLNNLADYALKMRPVNLEDFVVSSINIDENKMASSNNDDTISIDSYGANYYMED